MAIHGRERTARGAAGRSAPPGPRQDPAPAGGTGAAGYCPAAPGAPPAPRIRPPPPPYPFPTPASVPTPPPLSPLPAPPGPLNRILQGPPGTGKTYRAVAEAVAIVEGAAVEALMAPGAYAATRARFDRYREEGCIDFVTFHPGYSYQDFVEGIRPQTTADNGLSYDVEPGVLKRIADLARCNWDAARAPAGLAMPEEERFERAFAQLTTEIEESPTGFVRGRLYRGFEAEVRTGVRERSLTLMLPGSGTLYRLPRHQLKALWLRRAGVRTPADTRLYNRSFFWAALRLLEDADRRLGPPDCARPPALRPHVLVIDEINRGNIASIFGELITLVEDDKRLGAAHALSVRLPYSPEERPFGLPPNLHLLGTMNTADRSTAPLDLALRRRFAFTTLAPDPQALRALDAGRPTGIDLAALMETLNARIGYLLGPEQLLGHAYFAGLGDFDALARRLRERVLPLLRELFHGDDEPLRLVLRDGPDKPAALHIVRAAQADPAALFGSAGRDLEPRVRHVLADRLTPAMVQAILG